VRKALSMAVDRTRISREAMRGYAAPADATGLAESQKKWKQMGPGGEVWTRRDLAAANRLLDEAGLARGADGVRAAAGGPLRYTLNTVQGWTDWAAAAEILRENLAEVGVAVTVKALDYDGWNEALRRGRFELSIGFGNRGPTPYEFYRGQMDSTLVRKVGDQADANFQRFTDPEATRLLRQVEQTSTPPETLALMTDLQKPFSQTTQIRFDVNGGVAPQLVAPTLDAVAGLPARLLVGPVPMPQQTDDGIAATCLAMPGMSGPCAVGRGSDMPYMYVVDQRQVSGGKAGVRGQILRITPRLSETTSPIAGFESFANGGRYFPVQ